MSKFLEGVTVGLRSKETDKVIAVYPEPASGSDEEIEKSVIDWYYKQNCLAEDELKTLYVDSLTEAELKERQG